MPWRESRPMDERVKFIAAYLKGEMSLIRVCESFGVSRKTGYKWIERYVGRGVQGLMDMSRRPRTSPNAVSDEIQDLLVEARKQHPFWGPKKVLVATQGLYPGLRLPAASTVGDILTRHGLTRPRRRSHRTPPYTQPFLGYDQPNAVWCADFKGDFQMGNGQRCYPLTISDGFSRYLLKCEGLKRTRESDAKPVFELAFREFGLPFSIRTDNGAPFSSRAPAGLSFLAIWWIRLGIRPERIQPGHPEQNGRHERMHRTLKAETARPPRANMKAQQSAFDRFRGEYNRERPHEALGQRPPAAVYEPSPRPFPAIIPPLEYPPELETRRVKNGGRISWDGALWYVSDNLSNEIVGVKPIDDHKCIVYFGRLQIGVLAPSMRRKPHPGHKAMGKIRPLQGAFDPLPDMDDHSQLTGFESPPNPLTKDPSIAEDTSQ